MSKSKYTSIGGQAVLEGIMMKGPERTCLSVRKENGEIVNEISRNRSVRDRHPILKWPILRGVAIFIESMITGYHALMKSADMSGIELDEESKFDRWLAKTFGASIMAVVGVVAMVLGVLLALGLFTALPAFLIGLLRGIVPPIVCTILEGAIKIGIFVLYVYLISRMKDIQRVFQYHGAEHKTIFCYESGTELTAENVRGFQRFHPRCGTSFMLITLVISILVFSVVSWDNIWLRVGLKILSLPVIFGLSYEVIRFNGRYDNVLTRMLAAPGMWMQRLTTCEPDDSQIEVAISALKRVIPGAELEEEKPAVVEATETVSADAAVEAAETVEAEAAETVEEVKQDAADTVEAVRADSVEAIETVETDEAEQA